MKFRRMKRPHTTSKNWIYSWLCKSSRTRQQSYRSESFAMKTDILIGGSTVKKPHLLEIGIRIQCNTENFLLIVVPGLWTSLSSSSHFSTSMTPSRQESNHPTSSSRSTISPTTTIPRKEDLSGIDSHPVPVPSPNFEEMIERWDPLFLLILVALPSQQKTK